jgi:hypothetical protein
MKYLGNPQSGSQAGTTASHNRAGQYLRSRRAPVQPIGTGRRAFIRAAFGAAAMSWSSLTTAEQASWTAYAISYPVTDALGQSITLTGQQMWISITTQLANCGQTANIAPPPSNAQDTIIPASLDFGSIATPTVTATWTPGASGNFVLIAFSRPVSNGVNFMKTFWQAGAEAATLGTINVLTEYTAQFGLLVNGNKVFCRFTPVNQYGVTGTPVIVSLTVNRT